MGLSLRGYFWGLDAFGLYYWILSDIVALNYFPPDLHCLGQLASAEGGHADREHRGRL